VYVGDAEGAVRSAFALARQVSRSGPNDTQSSACQLLAS
jgi:hypothetical protein